MAIPYALFARGLREIGAPEAGLIGLVEPILNPIWVVLFVHERPAGPTVIGGLFLLAGLAYRYWPARSTLARVGCRRRTKSKHAMEIESKYGWVQPTRMTRRVTSIGSHPPYLVAETGSASCDPQ